MKNKILKMIMLNGVTIAIFLMMGYNLPSTFRAETRIIDPNNQRRRKERKKKQQNTDDNIFPSLSKLQWEKIGKVSDMYIYPVKSSVVQATHSSNSYDFFDYGMCEKYNGTTYFYDGMFIVYNKTKDRFEDARTYFELQNITADPTEDSENAEVELRYYENTIKSNIHQNRYLSDYITRDTWSEDNGTFYYSNVEVNTWVQDKICSHDDIILTQMIPSDFESTQKIKDNWNHFVQGYKNMEEDNTGRLITLPRFVLMSSKTLSEFSPENLRCEIAPNVIIDTDEIMPFEEINWKWIRIGENVTLRNVMPVPRGDLNEEFQHRGIYCGLWTGGRVSINDDVFIGSFSHKKKHESPRQKKLELLRF